MIEEKIIRSLEEKTTKTLCLICKLPKENDEQVNETLKKLLQEDTILFIKIKINFPEYFAKLNKLAVENEHPTLIEMFNSAAIPTGRSIEDFLIFRNFLPIYQRVFKTAFPEELHPIPLAIFNLFKAIQENKPKKALRLLPLVPVAQYGTKNSDGHTALHVAVTSCPKIVHDLVKAGFDIEAACDKTQSSALHLAAAFKQFSALKTLVEAGAIVTRVDKRGFTVLHVAAERGHSQIVKYLLSLDVPLDVDAQSAEHITPLHLAATHGHIGVIKILLAHQTKLNLVALNNFTAVEMAIDGDHHEATKLLLSAEHDIGTRRKKAIKGMFKAVEKNNTEMMDTLLSFGVVKLASKKLRGRTLFSRAVILGHVEALLKLLAYGVDYSERDDTGSDALMWAAFLGHIAIIKILKNFLDGNRINKMHLNALFFAILAGQTESVKQLLLDNDPYHDPIKINHKAIGQLTVLHVAIVYQRREIIFILLQQPNIDIYAKAEGDDSALEMARKCGDVSIRHMLEKKHAELQQQRDTKLTAPPAQSTPTSTTGELLKKLTPLSSVVSSDPISPHTETETIHTTHPDERFTEYCDRIKLLIAKNILFKPNKEGEQKFEKQEKKKWKKSRANRYNADLDSAAPTLPTLFSPRTSEEKLTTEQIASFQAQGYFLIHDEKLKENLFIFIPEEAKKHSYWENFSELLKTRIKFVNKESIRDGIKKLSDGSLEIRIHGKEGASDQRMLLTNKPVVRNSLGMKIKAYGFVNYVTHAELARSSRRSLSSSTYLRQGV